LQPFPALVTTYEILRSQDYVMITFSAPTGEVKDGQMQTQEVQKLAFTYPRFLELAANIAQIAATLQAPPPGRRVPTPLPVEDRAVSAQSEGESRAGQAITGRVIRH
jgi:hypothetical protein